MMSRTRSSLIRSARGFTLIELIVSIAIFSIVMLVATGAYLSLISMDRRARATNDVVTSLSFGLDEMARSIRTGSDYQCGHGAGVDCWPNSGSTFLFTDENRCPVSFALLNGQLVESIGVGSGCTTITNAPLTDPRVTVTSLQFFLRGSAPGDAYEPNVIISIKGTVTPDQATGPIDFTIETSATQRLIDL